MHTTRQLAVTLLLAATLLAGHPDSAGAASSAESQVAPPAPASGGGPTDEPGEAPRIAARIFNLMLGDGALNAVLSPLSLEVALAVIGEGAESSAASLIETALGRPLAEIAAFDEALSSDKAQVLSANAVWLPSETSVLAAYRDKISAGYQGDVKVVNFTDPATLDQINAWTSEKTEHLIPRVIERLSPQTSLVATNALYFKSAWLQPFDQAKTQDKLFTTADGRAVEVPTMSASGRFAYGETDANQLLALPYADPAYSMLIILPKAEADGDLARMEALAYGFKHKLPKALVPKTVELSLPRFVADARDDLTRHLATEGLSSLFGSLQAFSEIGRPAPVITAVLQGCVVKVDETGTEAAAATAVIGLRSLKIGEIAFVVDRPFYFAIHHKAVPTALIAGYVADPSP